LPCFTELDLICVAPLWLSGGRTQDYWDTAARVAATASPSAQVVEALEAIDSPWGQLMRTLLTEKTKPGSGVEALARFAGNTENPPQLAALALRNLIVLLIRHKELAKAEQVLDGAISAYPDYAELLYVGAFVHIALEKSSKAFNILVQAIRSRARATPRNFVGSGGENSYRAAWLLGKLAVQAGDQRLAVGQFYQGMMNQPAFAPAVDEILNLQLPPVLVELRQFDFCRLVRQEPRYLARVFDYLLLHRAFPAARRIIATMSLSDSQQEALREKLESAERPFLPSHTVASRSGVLLSGPVFEHSSLARINRESRSH